MKMRRIDRERGEDRMADAEIQVTEVRTGSKGRILFRLANGVELALYRTELRGLSPAEQACLKDGGIVPVELYRKLVDEVVGSRAKKRAMHLLEQMDCTEHQLCEKLRQSGYPEECVAQALAYVKGYHYVDDLRYAKCYVRNQQYRKSRGRLQADLMRRGVSRENIAAALAGEYDDDEREKIRALMQKRQYDSAVCDEREQRRMYQYLLRRGYRSSDILSVMRRAEEVC